MSDENKRKQISEEIERKLRLDDPWYQLVLRMLKSSIHRFEGKSVLEVGCGFGTYCIHLAKLGARVIGVDLSPAAIREGKNLTVLSDVQSRVDFVIADAQFLPFKNQASEILICSETLEHVPNYEKALNELARITAKSGYLCITIPNILSTALFEYVVLLLIGQPQYLKERACLEKEHIFHIFKLRNLLERTDVKVVKIESTDFLHLPPRVRKALKISRSLQIISGFIEQYAEVHRSPLRFFGANIGVLAKK